MPKEILFALHKTSKDTVLALYRNINSTKCRDYMQYAVVISNFVKDQFLDLSPHC